MTMETMTTEIEQTPTQPAEKRLSSRYRGVCWNKKNNRWQSAINRGGRYIYLGSFTDELEAAKAFDRAAVKLRGKSAKINFAFTDYPAEMSWHKLVMARADNPDAVLSNPKLLREKVDMQVPGALPSQLTHPPFMTESSFPNLPCNFHPTLQPYPMIHHVEPLRGRVVTQPQEGGNVSRLYPYLPAEGHPVDKRPIPTATFGGNMMFPTAGGLSFTSVGIPISEPVVKAEPVTTEPPKRTEQWIPVVNVPKGSEVTHLLRGLENSFAMSFIREDTTDTEVLLYDGQVMHEVGPFHSQEAAMQSSHFLLEFVNKFKSEESARNKQQASNEDTQGQTTTAQRHEAIENATEASFAEELEGKSPFEVPKGCCPAFDSEDAEENTKALGRSVVSIGEEHGSRSLPFNEGASDSLQKRMGSLLTLDPSLSFGSLNDPPLFTPRTDSKNDKSLQSSTDLSLINSGSLKNVLAVLNQSANFSSIQKEGEGNPPPEGLLPINISFPIVDDAGMAETPTMSTALSMPPFEAYYTLPENTIETQDEPHPVDIFHPSIQSGKRRALDLTKGDQGCKRMKGTDELEPCAF